MVELKHGCKFVKDSWVQRIAGSKGALAKAAYGLLVELEQRCKLGFGGCWWDRGWVVKLELQHIAVRVSAVAVVGVGLVVAFDMAMVWSVWLI